MNKDQMREILAQEYEQEEGMERIAALLRDPGSIVETFKFEGAALRALTRVRDWTVKECLERADGLRASIEAVAE